MGIIERMNEIIDYIITWLCYGDSVAAKRVAYTSDENTLKTHDVIIVPNGFFGKSIVLPDMKKPIADNPAKGKYILRLDIVYNTFFFTSRAEELINSQRDNHGRFLAAYSILGKGNRLQIPMLDEYARLLMKCLGLPLPAAEFDHIYLTHDIDTIAQYRHLRGAIGGLWRKEGKQVWNSLIDIHRDPLYTFPWVLEQDALITNAKQIYFIKHTNGRGYDYPQYCLWGRDFRHLSKTLKAHGAQMGLHSSYYGIKPCRRNRFTMHRSHFLRCSIEQMANLTKAGITDDFTMAFADQAGFRMQTTRAIHWIDPRTYTLTSLVLHPLMIMDNTLSQSNYMNLSENEAYFLCERLILKTKMHHGDLCLLWHNSIFTNDAYHCSLYPKILALLK